MTTRGSRWRHSAATQSAITAVDVVGIATSYCVRATALDAVQEGFATRVLTDLVADVDPGAHGHAVAPRIRRELRRRHRGSPERRTPYPRAITGDAFGSPTPTVAACTSNSSAIVLVVAVFLASSVEMVEALTIVVAAGVSRGWRSAFEGVAAAIAALAFWWPPWARPSCIWCRSTRSAVVVGAVLLVFGLQWLRKAVLRATGYKAKHDEDAIFAREVEDSVPNSGAARGGIPEGSRWRSRGCSSKAWRW